ncbi:hypothetical protein AC629_40835, partial [Bradyrhizobium sp. NAS80.1]|uniref:GAF domain-containing protein n=1 Tax=Bradyrhizobium sp. NAS80.1 TaxID=1680159 RepID=UPI00095A431B
MTALPQDVVAELKTRIAELEQGLQASAAETERLEHALFLSRDRQQATAEVLQVISRSAFDLDAVLQTLVEIAAKLCRADAAQIYRREGELYRSAAMCGNINETYRAIEEAGAISVGPGTLVGRVALEGKPVQIADAWNDPRYGAGEDARIGNLRSMLGVPLIRNGDQIGAFALARDHVEAFSDGEVELVRTFADQAVIAIENARLFQEVQQRTDDLGESLQQQTATADVLKVISRSAFDLEAVLNTLTESAARLCDADMAAITRQQADGGYAHATRYNFAPEWERVSSAIRLYPGRGSLVGRVLLEGKAVQITDVLADPEYAFHEQQQAGGYRTLLGVPLVREGQPTGVLFLGRATVKPFSNRQIELVQTFADQAVIAIENVRLFDEVQAKTRDLSEALQQQTATAEVLKVISRSTFDLPAVLHALVETAARLCGADKGTITRQKDGAFYRAESYGFSEAFMDFVRGVPVIVDRHSATGRALLESVVVHIPDVEADREYTFREGQRLGHFRSLLGVPMLREGLPIGVITLTRTESGGFTDKQIELAMTFADQAAIAIGNVQLFDAVQTRTRELAQSLEDLRTAQDRLVQTEKLASLGQLTAGIAHEIKNPLNFVNNFAALS